jgi:hypothetical protein
MRVPFKTETDAFRVAAALGLLVAASIVLGLVTARAYGVVLFAAGIAAGVTFELAGREGTAPSALHDAAHAPHPQGATGGARHVLVVAGVALAGDALVAELGPGAELDVLAPIQASRSHHWASDLDHERQEARVRLDASLTWALRHGFTAKGQVGDADPLAAIEDELRDFGADEIVVAMDEHERASWLANRMLRHLERELDIPVRQVVVHIEETPPASPGAA